MRYINRMICTAVVCCLTSQVFACVPGSKRFYGVTTKSIDLLGQQVSFPIDIEYAVGHSEYNGAQFVQFRESVFVDFSNFRTFWPSIVAPLIPSGDANNKFYAHGMSVGSQADGSMLSRAHVTYENWSRACTKIPEFRGLKVTMKDRCITNKNFQSTFVVDVTATPKANGNRLELSVRSDLGGGNIPGWLRSFADIASFGTLGRELEKTRDSLLADLNEALNSQMNRQDILIGLAEGGNQALRSDELGIRDIIDPRLVSAKFVNENHRLLLVLESQGQRHFKQGSACSQFSKLNLGSTTAPLPPQPPKPQPQPAPAAAPRHIYIDEMCGFGTNTICR
ncbi:hypothetical protein [Tateyamaria sp. syn59]|uniref:hypothetical protein n=1 Tax=Tateyamaria sp. syn59 TaxID=2576942 RepID=UPI0011BED224|nr:hypothetical protein [Tateyamaria sp. syn59]